MCSVKFRLCLGHISFYGLHHAGSNNGFRPSVSPSALILVAQNVWSGDPRQQEQEEWRCHEFVGRGYRLHQLAPEAAVWGCATNTNIAVLFWLESALGQIQSLSYQAVVRPAIPFEIHSHC